MPFNPMEGPVTIPMEGISLQCMYDRLDYVIALSLLKCEEEKHVHCMPVLVHASTTCGQTFKRMFEIFGRDRKSVV